MSYEEQEWMTSLLDRVFDLEKEVAELKTTLAYERDRHLHKMLNSRSEALEQAAKVCDDSMRENPYTPPFVCADAIRAMKVEK